MNNITLNIKSILGSDIRVRLRIFEIVSQMNERAHYLLDFSGVEFISRSFADELITMTENANNKISIINTTQEVSDLLRVVRLGRGMKYAENKHIGVKNLVSMEDVELFFANKGFFKRYKNAEPVARRFRIFCWMGSDFEISQILLLRILQIIHNHLRANSLSSWRIGD